MAEKTTQTTPDPSDANAPASPQPQPNEARAVRRTVTLPVLPFAIVGSLLVAAVFFGGGLAVGVAIGDHHPRVGMIQPFTNRSDSFGGQPGFGQNHRRDGGQPGFGPNGGPNSGQDAGPNGGQDSRPAPTPAPTNG